MKSILNESVIQLPEEERHLTFVEFMGFIVRLITEAYSSPASDKYHETDVRKLMIGLNELGKMYGLSFAGPRGLDEGVQKEVKIG